MRLSCRPQIRDRQNNLITVILRNFKDLVSQIQNDVRELSYFAIFLVKSQGIDPQNK
jgi:hypothetical protein